MPRAYYNEIEPYAAQWLRNLIAGGVLPAGDVDTATRSSRKSPKPSSNPTATLADLLRLATAARIALMEALQP